MFTIRHFLQYECYILFISMLYSENTKSNTKHNIYGLHIVLYNLYKKGAFNMGKFKIPVASSSTVKTIRFPDKVIEQVENAIQGKDCTFSAFVVEAVRNALNELE